MSDNIPADDAFLDKLNAIEDSFLEGASPDMRWVAAKVRPVPRHATFSAQQSHEDAFEQQSNLAAENELVEHLEDAIVENWTHSAEGLTQDALPESHSAEAPASGSNDSGTRNPIHGAR